MSAPLDQRHLSASLQDFERHLLRFHAEVQTGKDEGAPSANAPLQWIPEFDTVGNFVASETDAADNVAANPAGAVKSRRLLLSLAGLVLTLGVGAICLTFASWEDLSSPAATASAPASAPLVKPQAEVAAPPPAVENAVAAAPVEAPSAPPPPPPAQNVTPAAPEPKQVQSVSILPDGSLASPDVAPPPLSAPPAPTRAPPVAPAASPAPSDPIKTDARGHRADTKAAKKPAAIRGAKPLAATAPSTPVSGSPAEAMQPAPPADGDGILQGAQRAVGSFTGAMKKLVGGN